MRSMVRMTKITRGPLLGIKGTFQVVPLNITDSIFAFSVIRTGQLIHEPDHKAVTD